MIIRFALLATAYLAFAGQISVNEVVAASASAALLVGLSLFTRSWQTLHLQVPPAVALRLVLAAAPKLVTDSVRVAPRLLSGTGQTGSMSQEVVAGAAAPQDVSWWAVFTLTASAPPNSFLITRGARFGEIMMHRLVGSAEK